MYDVWRAMRHAAKHDTQGHDGKLIMFALACAAIGGSAIFWWGVQSQMTDNKLVALGYTAILVLAPPFLTSFLIPWSPGGMLIQKLHSRTYGYLAVLGFSLYYLYYSFQLMLSWWLAQPVVADSNMVYQQVIVGLIGFIGIPALLWTPVSDAEIAEKVKQAQLVQQWKMQTRADIAILQADLLRAQIAAGVGYANLAAEERQMIADGLRTVFGGVDRTLQLMAGNLDHAARNVFGDAAGGAFSAPPFSSELQELIEYVADAIERAQSHADEAEEVALLPVAARSSAGRQTIAAPAAAPAAAPQRRPQHSAAPRRESLRYASEYEAALQHFGGRTWSTHMLADFLGKKPRTAFDRIQAWDLAGLIGHETDGDNSYYFLEVEG